jgi:hypothetical protein
MNIDPGINARRVRHADSEMVDIDLEGGKGEKFGSPRVSVEEMERLREEEKLSLAGIEHRSPGLYPTRTPSPLSRNHSLEIPGQNTLPPRQGAGSSSVLRRPPPIASHPDSTVRRYPQDEEPSVYRNGVVPGMSRDLRRERESSVFSEHSQNSQDGLLDERGVPSRSVSPTFSEPVASPVTITGPDSPRQSVESKRPLHLRKHTAEKIGHDVEGLEGLEGEMQEVSLDGNEEVRGGLREVTA